MLLSLGWLVEDGVSEVMSLTWLAVRGWREWSHVSLCISASHTPTLDHPHIAPEPCWAKENISLTVAHRTKPFPTLVYNTINLTSDTSFIHIVHHRMHIKTVQSTVWVCMGWTAPTDSLESGVIFCSGEIRTTSFMRLQIQLSMPNVTHTYISIHEVCVDSSQWPLRICAKPIKLKGLTIDSRPFPTQQLHTQTHVHIHMDESYGHFTVVTPSYMHMTQCWNLY